MLGIPRPGPVACSDTRPAESGQSLTEFVVVAAFTLIPLFFFVIYTGKWGFTQLRTIEAARYVAWERTIWRDQPPRGREWFAIKSDADLRNEAAVRFFGGHNGGLSNTDTGGGNNVDPILTRHDGRPLLRDLGNIQVATHAEPISTGISMKFLGTLMKLTDAPLRMTGPTAATVSVQLEGLPGSAYLPGNPLAKGPQFTAQAAVLTDAWTANGPAEETRIVQKFLPSRLMNNTATNAVKSAGGWLFPELNRLDFGYVDPEVQYGDRLQPYPKEVE
ncbi:hypothetical protein [Acidithiobacillus sp.]|uniref:hypothetical protein n=1 Tax=Acidithiobacillus sp. TaxID=1872118 RepID=UPI003D065EF1